MKRHEKKMPMPEYTKSGFHSTHPMHRNEKTNKIHSSEVAGLKHSVSHHGGKPAPGHRLGEDHKQHPKDNKIRSAQHSYNTFGENVPLPKGKMRNEDYSKY